MRDLCYAMHKMSSLPDRYYSCNQKISQSEKTSFREFRPTEFVWYVCEERGFVETICGEGFFQYKQLLMEVYFRVKNCQFHGSTCSFLLFVLCSAAGLIRSHRRHLSLVPGTFIYPTFAVFSVRSFCYSCLVVSPVFQLSVPVFAPCCVWITAWLCVNYYCTSGLASLNSSFLCSPVHCSSLATKACQGLLLCQKNWTALLALVFCLV